MKFDKLKSIWHKIAEYYHKAEHYFTDGTFALKVYPFLMHPCVQRARSNVIRLFAVLMIFTALYYFFAELITIIFSKGSIANGYSHHSTMELLIPAAEIHDERNIVTPLTYSMRTSYAMQSWLFIPFYFICITQITQRKLRLLSAVSSILFAVGVSLILSSTGGTYTVGGLHNLGFELSFMFGCGVMIFSGIAQNKGLTKLKWFAILAGLIGIGVLNVPIFIESEWTAVLERTAIHLLLIWEIAVGFAVLREVE